ncbi:MAG: M23 family metallopeptidase, partial [Sneathiella sp.]|nr:M23 family metallopeptidase [Sneathiella sp.]
TDIRAKTLSDMEKGVPVIAAADGRVGNLRDGIRDQYFSDYSKKKKKEIYNIGLGNVVILNHGKGWSTFYAHLKKGSLTVTKGQIVKKGEILGYVGMSGLTDFPHVHFELRQKKDRIDPFSGLTKGSNCGKIENPYWSREALQSLSYADTGFMASGFSETRPSGRKDLESGQKAQTNLNGSAPTLFFWSYYIGSRKGDIVTLKITNPKGQIVAEHSSKPTAKHQISRNVFLGKKRPASGWLPGLYRGEISIMRNGTLLKDSAVITTN